MQEVWGQEVSSLVVCVVALRTWHQALSWVPHSNSSSRGQGVFRAKERFTKAIRLFLGVHLSSLEQHILAPNQCLLTTLRRWEVPFRCQVQGTSQGSYTHPRLAYPPLTLITFTPSPDCHPNIITYTPSPDSLPNIITYLLSCTKTTRQERKQSSGLNSKDLVFEIIVVIVKAMMIITMFCCLQRKDRTQTQRQGQQHRQGQGHSQQHRQLLVGQFQSILLLLCISFHHPILQPHLSEEGQVQVLWIWMMYPLKLLKWLGRGEK
jgi:hypothetical protein